MVKTFSYKQLYASKITQICRFLSFIFFAVISTPIFAGIDNAKQIASLSSSSLYNLDNEALPDQLSSFLQSNPQIKGLLITENTDNEVFLQFHRKSDQLIFNKPLPADISQYQQQRATVRFYDQAIGDVLVYYKNELQITLTKQEKQWIEKNPFNKIAVMDYWPHDKFGNSLHTEILKLINKYSGTDMIPVKYETWSDGFSAATQGKDLHGIMGLSWSKEREENYFHYTTAYNFKPSYLITKKENTRINSIADLSHHSIYVKTQSVNHNFIASESPTTKVIDKKSIEDMYESLSSSDEAVAMIADFIDTDKIDSYGLKVVKEIYSRFGEISIGVHHQHPMLATIIDKAFKAIPKQELAILRDKDWSGKSSINNHTLSQEQKDYIKNKQAIKVCINPNWEPIEFKEKESIKGISIDVLNIIKTKTKLELDFIKTASWNESQAFLKQNKCDILPSAIKTEQRDSYANFTAPYLNYALAIITTSDKPLTNNLNSIVHNTMSRKKGSGLIQLLKKKYPDISIIETKGFYESIKEVIDENVYFTLSTIPVFSYYKSKHGLKNLQVAGYTKMKYNLSIAVTKEDLILLGILNKVLKTIPKSTFDVIHDKWANVKVIQKTNWLLISQITIVILSVLLFVLWNNKKLKSMVRIKTLEITQLLSSFDKNVLATRTDTKGIITYASEAFCDVSGYKQHELLGQAQNIMRHPDMHSNLFQDLWDTLKQGKTWRGEIKNLKKHEGFYWVDAVISPIYDKHDVLTGYSAIRHDITAKKEVEDLTINLENKVLQRTQALSEQTQLAKKALSLQVASEEKTRLLLTSVGEGIFGIDNKGIVNFINPSALDMLQYTETEILHQKIHPIIQPKHKNGQIYPENQSPMYKTLQGIEYTADDEILWRKDQSSFPVEYKSSPIINHGKISGAVVTFRDITHRVKAKEQLISEMADRKQSELLAEDAKLRLENITNSIPGVVYQFHTAGHNLVVKFVSTGIEKLHNIQTQDLMQNFDVFIHSIYQDDQASVLTALATSIRTLDDLSCDYRVISEDNNIRWLHVEASVSELSSQLDDVFFDNYSFEREAQFNGNIIDITEAKNAHAQVLLKEQQIKTIHKHTQESIVYASFIQSAILPDTSILDKHFNDQFIFWQPKDTVGGDIYFFEELRHKDEILIFCIDCTGHGVPGAFVSMLVKAIESQIITNILKEPELEVSPAHVMSYFNRQLKKLLKQENTDSQSNAGWDGGIIYYNRQNNLLKFAGAETPLYYVDNNGIFNLVKGNRYSVGYKKCDADYEYKETQIKVEKGMKFYCTTDGYLDQCGGEKTFPFGKKRFTNIIKKNHHKTMTEQQEILLQEMNHYESMIENNERIDDMTVMGFEI